MNENAISDLTKMPCLLNTGIIQTSTNKKSEFVSCLLFLSISLLIIEVIKTAYLRTQSVFVVILIITLQ